MSQRKAIAPLVSTLISLAALTACGSGAGTAAGSSDGKPVTITFWGWARGSQEVVNAFNASHRDVHVTFEKIPSGNAGGYAKISNAVKAGNEPDVFNIEYPMLPSFVNQGAVQDLTAQFGRIKSSYSSQTIELTTLAGKNWAIPLDASPQAFFYRKDLFDAHHISVPRTWDEFRTAAEQLKAADPATRIGTFVSDDPSPFEAMAWQAGARWFGTAGDAWTVDLRDSATEKVAEYWQGLIKDDLVRVQPGFSQQWVSSLQHGQTAGYLGAAWGAGALKSALPDESGKWAVAPIPSWDGQPASGMLGGSVFVVGKDSKHLAADVEFATWATSTPEGMRARIASGISSVFPADPALIPVAKAGFDTAFYGGQDIFAVFTDGSQAIRSGWIWGPSMGATNTALQDALGKLPSGTTLTQALEAGQDATLADLKTRGIKVASP